MVRGGPDATAARAFAVVADLEAVLWVGAADGAPVEATTHAAARRRLGSTCDGAVVELHSGVDLDTLGRVHGVVRGGGVLVLRLPERPLPGRSGRWVERHLSTAVARVAPRRWSMPVAAPLELSEQDELVATLQSALEAPGITVVTADRGRGKSAGVGRALATLPTERRVVVGGPHPAAISEVLAFSGRAGVRGLRPLELLEAVEGRVPPEVVVVDEAARVPVGLLQALVRAAPQAHFVFATTVHGYEGTGRGFQHRFLPWLHDQAGPVRHLTLRAPVRWSAGDPLERFVFDLLALDAQPAEGVGAALPAGRLHARHEVVDRDRLVADPELLRSVFGLLVAAHYRTTPSDLLRLLDLPEVALHVAWLRGLVVAVGWLQAEGRLTPAAVAAAQRGVRPMGHALAETLICHGGRPEAGALRMWRSVRTAVHPRVRRRGLARDLIAHEHRHHVSTDLFGTMFGASAPLVELRRALGYEVVRVGLSRNARTGVPSVVMLRPASEAGAALVRSLRRDLARDLPLQLERLDQERGVPLDGALQATLRAGLPAPSVWSDAALRAAMVRLDRGATQLDAVGDAPRRWLLALEARGVDWRALLDDRERAAVEGRVIRGQPWHVVGESLGGAGIHVVQRAVRRGLRAAWRGGSES